VTARKVWVSIFIGGAVLMLGAGSYMARGGDFDSNQWKALQNSTARDNPRAGMISDLQKRVLRTGMTRAELIALLGEPDLTESEGNRYVYEIGTSAFGVDYEYFVIEFDSAGKLLRHSIRRG
jgi:outer membrane protein assembly factor BamE (lipoprotein component of BamABCDE complex)